MFKFKKPVRVRFAPSPTGAPHVGNIRTALFAWLFARREKGTFILRIEDTDQARAQKGSVEAILESLAWLGLDIDEGVVSNKGGDEFEEVGKYGPYLQSKRLDIYKKHAEELVDKKHAYYCFCSEERLAKLRKEQEEAKRPPRYDGHCLKLSADEAKQKIAAGSGYVIRMKVPQDGQTVFTDAVKGKVSFENKTIDHQVLLKSDGFPTYHLASVVDDHLMRISHVIRADEWLPSTPKHVLLYKYFGWEAPIWVHLPIILGKDKSKLSKRHGDVAVLEYKKDYLPDALVNYLALLGWNPKTEQEIFTREELIAAFALEKINKNNPIFDIEKLNWMNGQYIKKMEPEELLLSLRGADSAPRQSRESRNVRKKHDGIAAVVSTLPRNDMVKVAKLAQERMEKLSDFEGIVSFLETVPDYDPKILIPKKSDGRQTLAMLNAGLDVIADIKAGEWGEDMLRETFFAYCEAQNTGKGELLWPIRVAVTGLKNSPDVFAVMDILGKGKTRERIHHAIELLSI